MPSKIVPTGDTQVAVWTSDWCDTAKAGGIKLLNQFFLPSIELVISCHGSLVITGGHLTTCQFPCPDMKHSQLLDYAPARCKDLQAQCPGVSLHWAE
ncbi:hypothetical protein PILCRDRAFT_830099 [Piloderma croceum F 1598]|uniref:Uncharacterized protein n=1 Tax=Piloderma croceum (strain F 1598) TaxID=765440 RepID=A0A0C3EUY0_PILCF|nr:hypothetical protein PILCRDRAFT_830099 [Piloderma croceum F 1598]